MRGEYGIKVVRGRESAINESSEKAEVRKILRRQLREGK